MVYKARLTSISIEGSQYTDLDTAYKFETEMTARMGRISAYLRRTDPTCMPTILLHNKLLSMKGKTRTGMFSLGGFKDIATVRLESGNERYMCETEIALVTDDTALEQRVREDVEDNLPEFVRIERELRYIKVKQQGASFELEFPLLSM